MRFVPLKHKWSRYTAIAGMAGAMALMPSIGVPAAMAQSSDRQPAKTKQTQPPKMTDAMIEGAIDDALFIDPATPPYLIDVTVTNGIAQLSGEVDSLAAKRRAGALAETVRGVRSVANRIEVEPLVDRSDAQVKDSVAQRLFINPATSSYQVKVEAKDGSVTLRGEVASWAERELSEQVASSVAGVTAIDNRIDVKFTQQPTDAEMMHLIEERLQWDTHVDGALIDVSTEDKRVTLSGTVGSAAEKSRARTLAWVDGVRSVDAEDLEVASWTRDDRFRAMKYQARSAAEIRDAIDDALLYDPRVLSTNVKALVAGSSVTLRGDVASLDAKRAAENIAQRTTGVSWVTNRLKVRPTANVSDTQLEERLTQQFQRDAFIESREISVDVTGGIAYLDGQVDDYFEKAHADTLASQTAGVTTVVNLIDVADQDPLTFNPYVDFYTFYDLDWYGPDSTATTYADDMELKQAINSELWWSPFVDSDEVTVTVDNGIATLTGEVDSWSERAAARENAYEGGAVAVINKINVLDDNAS